MSKSITFVWNSGSLTSIPSFKARSQKFNEKDSMKTLSKIQI